MTLAICHILPETVSSYTAIMNTTTVEDNDQRILLSGQTGKPGQIMEGGKFPTPYILFLAGFWLMQFLDQVAFKKVDKGH